MKLEPELLVGQRVGPYSVIKLIGEGGFAWVFEGRRADDDSPVALKILKPHYSGDKEFEARFFNESNVANDLKHPNIVRLQEVGHADRLTYLAMDLYPDSLASMLERLGPLPTAALIRIAIDIARALDYAHRAGIIHRDIKVNNIMLQSDGTAVLTDFGIARAVSGYVTATGANMTIGTPHYVSPEQAQGRKLDGRSDLYALGVTLYKAGTGELPFRSSDWFELARMHVEEPPAAPRKLRPELSPRLERVILKCLEKHPDDRYDSAETLLDDLLEIEDKVRTTETFGTAPRSTAELIRALDESKPKWLLPLLAVVVIVVVAAVITVLGTR